MDLSYHFSTREERKVKADHTIAFRGQTLQILVTKDEPSLVARKVEVHVSPEGNINIYDERRRMAHRVIGSEAAKVLDKEPQRKEPKVKKALDPESQARRRRWLFAM